RRGPNAYRVISDHLGSPRYVVNVANAADVPFVATYTAFGQVTGTGLDWMPFGYAGGIYDGDTQLLRFGARDYDPAVGRWTTKDPIRFAGGYANLHTYVGNDPINVVDPSGLKDYSEAEVRDLLNRYSGVLSSHPAPYLLMGELHGHNGDFDYWSQRRGDTFEICGYGRMTEAEFGNFIAGFAAGVLDDPLAYWIVRGAGALYGAGAGVLNVFGIGDGELGPIGLLGDTESSVHFINDGLGFGYYNYGSKR
ncbi:MAG TPA: RHS repeat-associated core domain-containing protein, partial [Polyangiaceae bacterium]